MKPPTTNPESPSSNNGGAIEVVIEHQPPVQDSAPEEEQTQPERNSKVKRGMKAAKYIFVVSAAVGLPPLILTSYENWQQDRAFAAANSQTYSETSLPTGEPTPEQSESAVPLPNTSNSDMYNQLIAEKVLQMGETTQSYEIEAEQYWPSYTLVGEPLSLELPKFGFVDENAVPIDFNVKDSGERSEYCEDVEVVRDADPCGNGVATMYVQPGITMGEDIIGGTDSPEHLAEVIADPEKFAGKMHTFKIDMHTSEKHHTDAMPVAPANYLIGQHENDFARVGPGMQKGDTLVLEWENARMTLRVREHPDADWPGYVIDGHEAIAISKNIGEEVDDVDMTKYIKLIEDPEVMLPTDPTEESPYPNINVVVTTSYGGDGKDLEVVYDEEVDMNVRSYFAATLFEVSDIEYTATD